MKAIFESLPAEAQEQLKETEQPAWTDPMLATLTDDYFSDEGWLFERKLDGERCLVFRNGDQIRFMSRNRKELTLKYPELVEAVGRQTPDQFILDGEIVAFEGNVTSFARLQQRMHIQDPEEARQSNVSVYCYFFDLLYLAGYDLTQIPLRHRKSMLKQTFSFEDPLRFMPHRNTDGEAFYQEACGKGWEGIIAKQADAPYVHSRSNAGLNLSVSTSRSL
jgi:ATP-dependent DNA ligase